MNTPVPVKIPQRALAAKNKTSGPSSSASFRSGLSCRFSFIGARFSSRQARNGAGEITRGERLQIVNPFADADEMHRQAESRRDGDQDATARGAVELGHREPGDAGRAFEHLDLG